MSFETHYNNHGKAPSSGVRMRMERSRTGKADFAVILRPDVLDQLGLAKGDYVLVQRGCGEHEGMLRLVKTEKTRGAYRLYVNGQAKARNLAIKFLSWVDLPATIPEAQDCRWRVIKRGVETVALEIDLPAWAGAAPRFDDVELRVVRGGKREDERGRACRAISE